MIISTQRQGHINYLYLKRRYVCRHRHNVKTSNITDINVKLKYVNQEFKSRCSQSIPCRWTGSRQDDVLVSAIKVLLQDVWPQADTELAKVNQLFPIPQSQYRMAVSVRSLCSATWVDTRVLCYQGLSSAAAQWPGVLCYCATVGWCQYQISRSIAAPS